MALFSIAYREPYVHGFRDKRQIRACVFLKTFFESLWAQEADNDGRCPAWMGEDTGKKGSRLLWSRADA